MLCCFWPPVRRNNQDSNPYHAEGGLQFGAPLPLCPERLLRVGPPAWTAASVPDLLRRLLARVDVRPAPVGHTLRQLAGSGLALDQVFQRAELDAAGHQLLLAVVAHDHDRDVLGPARAPHLLQERQLVT